MADCGILLVNLGTPASSENSAVYRYLMEFLLDERVIDYSYLKRNLLVRGIIVPFRYRSSAKTYRLIWGEEGSPLLKHSKDVAALLQKDLDAKRPGSFKVSLAMRYQFPSIEEGLSSLKDCRKIIIFPLFPQYASATTGSIHQKVMEVMGSWQVIPELSFISSYADHEAFISAWLEVISSFDLSEGTVLFSFHGLPKRQLTKAYAACGQEGCCSKSCETRRYCYRAQCLATAEAIRSRLNIPLERTQISFQSRLGRDPWLEPYTSDVLQSLAKKGEKVTVIPAAFVADCLETIYEIGMEYKEEFLTLGGKELVFIPSLNSHPAWVQAIAKIALPAELAGNSC
ncbi:MAG: hemH [Chlamydiales bacterium]|jgi:ferrochelatase|nr:hemH [Chlamydiales bacterium]